MVSDDVCIREASVPNRNAAFAVRRCDRGWEQKYGLAIADYHHYSLCRINDDQRNKPGPLFVHVSGKSKGCEQCWCPRANVRSYFQLPHVCDFPRASTNDISDCAFNASNFGCIYHHWACRFNGFFVHLLCSNATTWLDVIRCFGKRRQQTAYVVEEKIRSEVGLFAVPCRRQGEMVPISRN